MGNNPDFLENAILNSSKDAERARLVMEDDSNCGNSDDKKVGSSDYFPTQSDVKRSSTFDDKDKKFGAPFGPVPRSFRIVPSTFDLCVPLATDDELRVAKNCRKPFQIADYSEPYMNDIIRAFRMIIGRRTYLEVGTFDRGNLAYAAHLLAENAVIIGVDVQAEENRDNLLRQHLKEGQTYISIVGDSRDPATVSKVTSVLGEDRKLDVAFIDGVHTAHAVMCDYVNYGELMESGGLIMFHDSMWEGSSQYKGSADALAEIDRLEPIYLIDAVGPPHRFMRPLWRDDIWGVVGVRVVP